MGSGSSTASETDDSNEYVGSHVSEAKEDSSYLNEELSDFEIHVIHKSETWRFPCHKFVLCKHGGGLAICCEKSNSNELVIKNINPHIIEMVLRYVYEKEVLMGDWNIACDVLEVAYQYDIKPLVQECEEFLLKSLTFRNVCHILEKSKRFSLDKLRDQCLELCKNACFIVLKTQAFISLHENLVKDILENSDLNVRGEFFLFEALWNWSKIQCVCEGLPLTESYIGKKFSSIANYVRFQCMSDKQKELLPEFVKVKYSNCPQNTDKNSETTGNSQNRCVKFPLNLNKDYYFSLMFEAKENPIKESPITGSFICGIKFCVKLDAYVVSLTTLCLKSDSSLNYVKQLKLSSPAGVLFTWKEGNEKYIKKVSTRTSAFSVSDSTMVAETEYHAVRPLPLYVGMTYILEVEPAKKELEWPQTVAVFDRKKSDLEICLCDSLCCGLKNITFVQGK